MSHVIDIISNRFESNLDVKVYNENEIVRIIEEKFDYMQYFHFPGGNVLPVDWKTGIDQYRKSSNSPLDCIVTAEVYDTVKRIDVYLTPLVRSA